MNAAPLIAASTQCRTIRSPVARSTTLWEHLSRVAFATKWWASVLLLTIPFAGFPEAQADSDPAEESREERPARAASASATATVSANPATTPSPAPAAPQTLPMDVFLDRLMAAESGGRADARNPRSTAVGPFQFIEATFLYVARKYFAPEVAALTDGQILALRTDFVFSRRAASAYTRENAAYLTDQNIQATSAHLRLAFLVGPAATAKLLAAKADTPVATLLSPQAVAANPFMARMSVQALVDKAASDISGEKRGTASLGVKGVGQRAAKPDIQIRCNLGLASCRKWVALQRTKAGKTIRSASRSNPNAVVD